MLGPKAVVIKHTFRAFQGNVLETFYYNPTASTRYRFQDSFGTHISAVYDREIKYFVELLKVDHHSPTLWFTMSFLRGPILNRWLSLRAP